MTVDIIMKTMSSIKPFYFLIKVLNINACQNSDLYKSTAEFLEVSTANISLLTQIDRKRNINYTKEIFEFTRSLEKLTL